MKRCYAGGPYARFAFGDEACSLCELVTEDGAPVFEDRGRSFCSESCAGPCDGSCATSPAECPATEVEREGEMVCSECYRPWKVAA